MNGTRSDVTWPALARHPATDVLGMEAMPEASGRSAPDRNGLIDHTESGERRPARWFQLFLSGSFWVILAPMVRARMLLRAWIALLVIAVATMPASGAHLHLCFDGSEAPATVHATEDGAHHSDAGLDGTHNDVDVSLAGVALSKKFDSALDLPGLALLTSVLFHLAVPEAVLAPRELAAPLIIRSVFRILPPSRGPPLQASTFM